MRQEGQIKKLRHHAKLVKKEKYSRSQWKQKTKNAAAADNFWVNKLKNIREKETREIPRQVVAFLTKSGF